VSNSSPPLAVSASADVNRGAGPYCMRRRRAAPTPSNNSTPSVAAARFELPKATSVQPPPESPSLGCRPKVLQSAMGWDTQREVIVSQRSLVQALLSLQSVSVAQQPATASFTQVRVVVLQRSFVQARWSLQSASTWHALGAGPPPLQPEMGACTQR